MVRRIIIREVILPPEGGRRETLRSIGESLDVLGGRDIDETGFRILCELHRQSKMHDRISTKLLAEALRIEPPTINHHLRNFLNAGILERQSRQVAFRGGSLQQAIQEMRREADNMFAKMDELSRRLG